MKDLKIFTDNVEVEALNQINELLDQDPFKDCKVRIMPDVHAGKGCVIGFTANLGDKIIPNIVGVDIGCGMLCVKLGNINIDLARVDNIIRDYVPSGFNIHDKPSNLIDLKQLYCYDKLKNIDRISKSLGTLGGGNHFIEIDVDKQGNKYLIIHTGSRNLGKQVAEIYQDLAIDNCSYNDEMNKQKRAVIQLYKSCGREKDIQSALNDIDNKYKGKTKLPKDLCYLDGDLRDKYLHDMKICQDFAVANRDSIAYTILSHLWFDEGPDVYSLERFENIHNYISFDDNIVRKGAISAKKNELLLIPLNMKDGCILGMGKGNDDWNCSAPHGAGRLMSRAKARKELSLDDYKNSMQGIYTTSINTNTLDEAPLAYKPMDNIINNIGDTVDIIDILKPIYNFKDSDK